MLRAAYPDASPNTIANNTGQVWHFVNTIALGDLVVVPLKASRSFRVGRVVGPAEHREDLAEMAAVRPVEWEAAEVASQALAADLRNALGSIMTVFRPRAQAAERRLESILKDGRDPGPDSGGDDRSGAWVFQANPRRFDLLQALRDGSSRDVVGESAPPGHPARRPGVVPAHRARRRHLCRRPGDVCFPGRRRPSSGTGRLTSRSNPGSTRRCCARNPMPTLSCRRRRRWPG